jgi:hypothetical protein
MGKTASAVAIRSRPIASVCLLVLLASCTQVRAGAVPPFATLAGDVYAVLQYAGQLVVGGDFTRAGRTQVGYLAAWDGNGWVSFPPLDGPVHALVALGADLIIGGDFTSAGGTPAAHVARWDGSQWHALGAGTDAAVRCFVVQAGVLLYAGGDFTNAGGASARGVALWVGNSWSALGQGLDGEVRALLLHGGQLVAGGDFATHEGTGFERHIAIFTGTNWLPLANGIDAAVHALASYQGALVIGGEFTQADWVTPVGYVARLVGSGENWSRVGFGFGGVDSVVSVRALHVHGDDLFAGGEFSQADLQPAAHVARFDGAGWSQVHDGLDATVFALGSWGTAVVAGGAFARWNAPGVATSDDGPWTRFVETPIAVADFTASSQDGWVRLAWRLEDPGAWRAVSVERAAVVAGPYEEMARLAPAPTMSQVLAAGESAWFRLALEAPDGARTFAGPLFAGAGVVSRLQLHAVLQSNGALAVRYALARPGEVALDLFDVRGRRLHRLDAGPRPAGERALVWDGAATGGHRLARGTYWLQLQSNGERTTRRIVFSRP